MASAGAASLRNTRRIKTPQDHDGLAAYWCAWSGLDFLNNQTIPTILNTSQFGTNNVLSSVAGQGWRVANVNSVNQIVDSNGMGPRPRCAFSVSSLGSVATANGAWGIHNSTNQDYATQAINSSISIIHPFVASQFNGLTSIASAANNTQLEMKGSNFLPCTITSYSQFVSTGKNYTMIAFYNPGSDCNVSGQIGPIRTIPNTVNSLLPNPFNGRLEMRSLMEGPAPLGYGPPSRAFPYEKVGTVTNANAQFEYEGTTVNASALNNRRNFASTNSQTFWLMQTARATTSSFTLFCRQVNGANNPTSNVINPTGSSAGYIVSTMQLKIGNWSGTTTSRPCAVTELMFYERTLSDSEVQQIEGYLAHQYGAITCLPDNHPYRVNPPRI